MTRTLSGIIVLIAVAASCATAPAQATTKNTLMSTARLAQNTVYICEDGRRSWKNEGLCVRRCGGRENYACVATCMCDRTR